MRSNRARLNRALGLCLVGCALSSGLLLSGLSFAGVPAAFADPLPDPPPIANWFGANQVPDFDGSPHVPAPVAGDSIPQHPFTTTQVGASTMHADSYMSDTHVASGPLGYDLKVRSHRRAALGGQCSAMTFDTQGRIWSVCATFREFRLVVMDPTNLADIASLRLAQRPSSVEFLFTLDLDAVMTDTSGGAYFYLDDQDRAVLADADQVIQRIALVDGPGGPELVPTESWDVESLMPRDCWSLRPLNLFPSGDCDAITTVMPDWDGKLWWVTRLGRVGITDPDTGTSEMIELAGEEIQNAFAVDADGAYIVSDHAMYGFVRGYGDVPEVAWREEYDRGTGGGIINQGSGTTPTLLDHGGERYVAISDNADGRVNAVVYRRDPAHAGDRLACTEPLFEEGASVTDNSFIGYGNMLVVENNWGHENFLTLIFGKGAHPGVSRVDIEPDGPGSGCETVWESDERSPSVVPKLSVANGLVYLYTKYAQPRFVDAWYLTALDVRTGETKWRKLTGTGWGFDNNWSPISIGPDGTLFVGVFNGIISIRDTA